MRALTAAALYSKRHHSPLSSKLAAFFAASTAATCAVAGLQLKPSLAVGDDLSHLLYADEQRTVAVFEKSSASVVHINTFVEEWVRSARGYALDVQEIPKGSGSGFLWDSQHIVTNFHVIQGASKATVVFSDHSSCEASLVAAEPDADLAVLRIDNQAKRRVPLEIGQSSNLHVGQRVLAIGNPFGLDQTLTSGIVSGLGREMRGVSGRKIRGLIQTDAAINPGNSGGPLLDARGRLIGVNTMIASPSGAFAGVGFAIPVDTVNRIVNQLVHFGHIRRAFLGVGVVPDHAAQGLGRQLQVPGGIRGALVLNVEPGSPAEQAGLRSTRRTSRGVMLGDEIISLGGVKLKGGLESLLDAVDSQPVGADVELVYRRFESSGVINVRKTAVCLAERQAPSRGLPGHEHSHGLASQRAP